MALLQLLLLLLYALPSFLLPITSNPLGVEDTPDNLAWAAQSLEIRSEQEGVRKIPKSIFIAPDRPELNCCPNGYKWQNGHCVRVQNFDVNPLALITSQFQSFLDKAPTTADYDDYEYYDSTESAGPLHIPLSVSFDDVPPARDTVKDGIQSMPFLADDTDRTEEASRKTSVPTSTESRETESANVVSISSTGVSNDDKWTDGDVAKNKDSTRTNQDVNPTTPGNVVVTTDDSSLIFVEDVSTTQKKVLVDTPDNSLENEDEAIVSTENELIPTTTTRENESMGKESESDQLNVAANLVAKNVAEVTTENDDEKMLDKELQSESFFQDDSVTGLSINVSDGTTEINENEIDVSTESLNSVNDKVVNKAISISTPAMPLKNPSNKIENPIVVVPTVEQVQIVTPVQHTTTSHSTTHNRKKSHSEQSTKSAYNSELQTAERLDINESMLNKKLRDSVMKHELNEDAIETIDTNNRFVYTHLDTSSNEPEPSTSTTRIEPITQRSLFEPLRLLNKSAEDSRKINKIRFPEATATTNIFSNFQGGLIKFPGPVQQRASEPLYNRLIPDIIPKKPPEPTAARPLFSWLPAGTAFNFNRKSGPQSMRFWNKMPLIRDRAVSAHDLPEQPRSNSRSPTDNLYKDAPVSEMYKVISTKNYKHDNR